MEEFGFYPKCKKWEAIKGFWAWSERISLHFDRMTLANVYATWPLSLLTVLWNVMLPLRHGSWDSEKTYLEPIRRGFQLWLDLSLKMPHPYRPFFYSLRWSCAEQNYICNYFFFLWRALLAWDPELSFPLRVDFHSILSKPT